MNHIQPGLDLFQLVGGIAQIVPGTPNLLRRVLNLVHEIRHPVVESREAVAEPGQPSQGILRLGKKSRGSVGILPTVETLHGGFHAVAQLLRVLQHLPPLLQPVVLPGFQLRLFDFGDLVFEVFHPAKLLALVHGQGADFPAELRHRLVAFPVGSPQLPIVRESVQKGQVVFLVKQCGGIVLTVNIDELDAQLMKARHVHEGSVDPADIFPVQVDFPGNHRLRVIFHAVFRKPGKFRNIREHRPNAGPLGAGTNHVPIGPFPQDGGNGVDDNGFTCAGLAGEDIEATVKGNIRTLNDRDILNVQ